MEKLIQIANLYVATLRSLYLTFVWCHWSSRGSSFYSDHLLFERLYKSVAENSDLAGEKMLGLFPNCLDYDLQTELIGKISTKYASLAKEPLEMALKAEKDFLDLSKEVFAAFEQAKVMTLGLDDALCLIADKNEEAVYLLQQAIK